MKGQLFCLLLYLQLPKSSKTKSKKLDVTIFLAGESGVGKHWLINQYVNGDASKATEKAGY